MQRDDEITRVPATHRERERGEYPLDAAQLAAVSNKLEQHPKRQQRADAVTDDLKYFEWIEWGHLSL